MLLIRHDIPHLVLSETAILMTDPSRLLKYYSFIHFLINLIFIISRPIICLLCILLCNSLTLFLILLWSSLILIAYILVDGLICGLILSFFRLVLRCICLCIGSNLISLWCRGCSDWFFLRTQYLSSSYASSGLGRSIWSLIPRRKLNTGYHLSRSSLLTIGSLLISSRWIPILKSKNRSIWWWLLTPGSSCTCWWCWIIIHLCGCITLPTSCLSYSLSWSLSSRISFWWIYGIIVITCFIIISNVAVNLTNININHNIPFIISTLYIYRWIILLNSRVGSSSIGLLLLSCSTTIIIRTSCCSSSNPINKIQLPSKLGMNGTTPIISTTWIIPSHDIWNRIQLLINSFSGIDSSLPFFPSSLVSFFLSFSLSVSLSVS